MHWCPSVTSEQFQASALEGLLIGTGGERYWFMQICGAGGAQGAAYEGNAGQTGG